MKRRLHLTGKRQKPMGKSYANPAIRFPTKTTKTTKNFCIRPFTPCFQEIVNERYLFVVFVVFVGKHSKRAIPGFAGEAVL